MSILSILGLDKNEEMKAPVADSATTTAVVEPVSTSQYDKWHDKKYDAITSADTATSQFDTWKAKKYGTANTSNRGMIDKVFGMLGYTGVTEGLYNMVDDDENSTFVSGLKEGLHYMNPLNEDVSGRHLFSDVLKEAGWEDNPDSKLDNVARGLVGFAGDVVLDPLSYLNPYSSVAKVVKGTGVTVEAAKELTRATKVKKVSEALDKINSGTNVSDKVKYMKGLSDDDAVNTVKKYYVDTKQAMPDDMMIQQESRALKESVNKKILHMSSGGQDLEFGFRNMPGASKVGIGDKTLADFNITFAKSDKLRALGDNTIAPYYNSLAKKIRYSGLGKKFNDLTDLESLYAKNPLQAAAITHAINLTNRMDASTLEKSSKDIQGADQIRKYLDEIGDDAEAELLRAYESGELSKASGLLRTKANIRMKIIDKFRKDKNSYENNVDKFNKGVRTRNEANQTVYENTKATKEQRIGDLNETLKWDEAEFNSTLDKKVSYLEDAKAGFPAKKSVLHKQFLADKKGQINELESAISDSQKNIDDFDYTKFHDVADLMDEIGRMAEKRAYLKMQPPQINADRTTNLYKWQKGMHFNRFKHINFDDFDMTMKKLKVKGFNEELDDFYLHNRFGEGSEVIHEIPTGDLDKAKLDKMSPTEALNPVEKDRFVSAINDGLFNGRVTLTNNISDRMLADFYQLAKDGYYKDASRILDNVVAMESYDKPFFRQVNKVVCDEYFPTDTHLQKYNTDKYIAPIILEDVPPRTKMKRDFNSSEITKEKEPSNFTYQHTVINHLDVNDFKDNKIAYRDIPMVLKAYKIAVKNGDKTFDASKVYEYTDDVISDTKDSVKEGALGFKEYAEMRKKPLPKQRAAGSKQSLEVKDYSPPTYKKPDEASVKSRSKVLNLDKVGLRELNGMPVKNVGFALRDIAYNLGAFSDYAKNVVGVTGSDYLEKINPKWFEDYNNIADFVKQSFYDRAKDTNFAEKYLDVRKLGEITAGKDPAKLVTKYDNNFNAAKASKDAGNVVDGVKQNQPVFMDWDGGAEVLTEHHAIQDYYEDEFNNLLVPNSQRFYKAYGTTIYNAEPSQIEQFKKMVELENDKLYGVNGYFNLDKGAEDPFDNVVKFAKERFGVKFEGGKIKAAPDTEIKSVLQKEKFYKEQRERLLKQYEQIREPYVKNGHEDILKNPKNADAVKINKIMEQVYGLDSDVSDLAAQKGNLMKSMKADEIREALAYKGIRSKSSREMFEDLSAEEQTDILKAYTQRNEGVAYSKIRGMSSSDLKNLVDKAPNEDVKKLYDKAYAIKVQSEKLAQRDLTRTKKLSEYHVPMNILGNKMDELEALKASKSAKSVEPIEKHIESLKNQLEEIKKTRFKKGNYDELKVDKEYVENLEKTVESMKFVPDKSILDEIETLKADLSKLNFKPEPEIVAKYQAYAITDDMIAAEMGYTLEDLQKLESLATDDKAMEFYHMFNRRMRQIGRDEVAKGKLSKEAFDKITDVYMPHIATDETKDFFNGAWEPDETGKWNPKILGLQKAFDKNRKFHSIEEANQKLSEYSFFKDAGIKKVFETNMAEIYMARCLGSNKLLFGDNVTNYIKNEICKPYNGERTLDKVVVPFSDLRKIMVKRLATDAQDSISDGVFRSADEIYDTLGLDKRFVGTNTPFVELDDDQIKKLNQLSVDAKDLKLYNMHDTVFDRVNKLSRTQQKMLQGDMIKLYDKFLTQWKLWNTIVSPGFHLQNAASNAFQSFLATGTDAINPAKLMKAVDILRTSDPKQTITLGGKKYTYRELKWLGAESGVLDNTFFRRDLSQESYQFLPYKLGTKVGSKIESTQRFNLFLSLLDQGKPVNEAVDGVNKFLFDYGDLTDFEKNTMKRVIPFYTFMRKNIPLELEQMVEHPQKFKAIERAMDEVQKNGDTEYVDENQRNEWRQEYIQFPWEVDGKTYGISDQLPYNQFERVFEPSKLLGQTSPLIKAPIEALTGTYSYTQMPIDSPSEYLMQQTFWTKLANMAGKKDAGTARNTYIAGQLAGFPMGEVQDVATYPDYNNVNK